MKRKTIIALAGLAALACSKTKDDALTIPLEPVSRQNIVVQAEATGVVEPINVIEVKSKSSGQIVAMPVETGSFVKAGDLIVQLDTRDTRNSYAQAKADLDAANVNLRVSRQARDRAEQLFKERIITAVEREAAQVGYANASATVLRNRASLDLRAQSLEEATVRAPVAGTVIEKPVALGQVIASGTSGLSAGTTIIKMADLTKVRVRTLVNESDIGKVRPGLAATVTVDAFPDRPFVGTVDKIEPQATIQQSVTMFPVLVSIDNQARLLMPGMNGEVAIQIERRDNVLAVPNDAVRNMNEVAAVAPLLGLDPDSVRAQLRDQGGGGQRRVGGTQGGGGQSPASDTSSRRGDLASPASNQSGAGGQRGGFRQRTGGGGQTANGADGAAGGRAGAATGAPAAAGSAAQGGGGTFGGGGGAGAGQGRRGLVFVAKDGKYSPRMVRLGVGNFDYSEVLSGVQEGEQVAILNVAAMQAKQQNDMIQVRGRAGVPGMQRQPTTGGAAGAGGAGGAGARPGGAGAQRGGGG